MSDDLDGLGSIGGMLAGTCLNGFDDGVEWVLDSYNFAKENALCIETEWNMHTIIEDHVLALQGNNSVSVPPVIDSCCLSFINSAIGSSHTSPNPKRVNWVIRCF